MTFNLVFHARTKHIELDVHYIREKVAASLLITHYVPSALQVADIFTKAPFLRTTFILFEPSLEFCLRRPRGSDKTKDRASP